MTHKITSNVWAAGGDNSAPSDAAVYLVKTGTGAVLIDSGTGRGTEKILSNIRAAGVEPSDIEYLFLTHCHFDHTGGAAGIKAITGAKVIAHELDAVFIESADPVVTAASWYNTKMERVTVDIKIPGKKYSFTSGSTEFKVYHTPGHTPGSCVATIHSDGMLVLFGQDIHGPLHPDLKSDRKDYMESLAFIASLDAEILCEGHYGVITGRKKVREFIESFIR
ncbi:MAG TPA: MBL fold metallo-hydrolase [Spirochaetota bacterium]|nr:MBL fold metallo-hydrolase [Spirochaetota bacterium]